MRSLPESAEPRLTGFYSSRTRGRLRQVNQFVTSLSLPWSLLTRRSRSRFVVLMSAAESKDQRLLLPLLSTHT
jgi:hypothetical protein